jgi:hypothetical protein
MPPGNHLPPLPPGRYITTFFFSGMDISYARPRLFTSHC